MEISELKAGEEQQWDAFIETVPEANFLHLSGWKQVLQKTYGHETRFLIAREKGKIQGVLPMFIIQHWFFGKQFGSLPGGICSNNVQAADALLATAVSIAEGLNVDHVSLNAGKRLWDGNLVTSQRHCTYRLALPDNSQALWKGFPSKHRTRIRRGQKNDLTVIRGGIEKLDAFYDIITQRLRNLGTPTFGKELVRNILTAFPERTHILNVLHDGQVVGAMFNFTFKDTVFDYWAACLPAYFRQRANEVLYWEALSWACDHGYACFDFGRSQWGSGTAQFKEKWGAIPQPLYYQYYLRRGTEIPDSQLKASQSKAQQLVFNAWQRMPLEATRKIGPYLRKNLYPL